MFDTAKPSVCFVALNSYNLIAHQKEIRHIGGAEVQQWLAANWLQANGYRISFITLDHGQSDGEQHQGMAIYQAYKREAGLPVLRFFWPRWSGLWSAMRRANCDVYYQRGAGLETGQVALWCRMHHRKFVHAVASELDCVPELPMLGDFRERLLYRCGLRLADAVVAQTEIQQKHLRHNFARESFLVRNCAVDDSSLGGRERSPGKFHQRSVLWIGRFAQVKRFEWLLELAETTPDIDFIVIGGANTSRAYDATLQKKAMALRNVTLVGEVPHAKMPEYYQSASVLCCTSVKEGFPNVFLEAWRSGVPVVTTVDPDGIVTKHRLGCVADSMTGLQDGLARIFSREEDYRLLSERCRAYFVDNHTPATTLPVLDHVLASMAQVSRAG